MAGQGTTTVAIAEALRQAGWTVVFTCIPNAPHVGVVPIPIQGGSAKQRYPDILSFRDHILRLTEVEMGLTDDVADNIIDRFGEQRTALLNPATWTAWRARVESLTGFIIPQDCEVTCELVVCNPIGARYLSCVPRLCSLAIAVYGPATYIA